MANCEDFKITLMNSTHGEIKVTRFEYKDGSNWKTEPMLGMDGHQKIEKDHGVSWRRDLEGIGSENMQFRITYQHRVGGDLWGDDKRAVTETFMARDNGSRTVTLTA